jgi:hypothetical protein
MKKDTRSTYEKLIDELTAEGKIITMTPAEHEGFALHMNKGMGEFENEQRARTAYTLKHINDFVMF